MRPILFHIGTLPVRSYGTMIVIGFLVGLWRAMRLCARRMANEPEGSPRRIHPDAVFDLGITGLLLGLVGARILFVILDWGSFAQRPAEAFKIWTGGLSLHGGMLAGILFLVAFCRKRKLSTLAVGDIGATSWAIAYAIGRIGCLLNGCCYGGQCDLPWAVRFPDELHPGHLTLPSHPVQIYATLFNLLFFAILVRWEKRSRADGELFYGYIGLYGFYRFVVEWFRVGGTAEFIPGFGLTLTHVVSLLMMIAGATGIVLVRRRHMIYADSPQLPASRPVTPTP